MYDGMMHDLALERMILLLCWEFTIDEEIGDFEEVGLFCELFDWVAAISQNFEKLDVDRQVWE